jgi:hypothetical protein
MALILRNTKGSKLTNGEVDGNFTHLDERIDATNVRVTTLEESEAGGYNLIEITYSELRSSLMNVGDPLSPGCYYLITDFKTCYDQPNYDYNKNSILTGNYKAASVNPIVVLAISEREIAIDAYQPEHPNDKIKYDWQWNATEVTAGVAYGRITERIDAFNNRTDYDHRYIQFRRYKYYEPILSNPYVGTVNLTALNTTNMTVIGTGTNFTELSTGSILSFDYQGNYAIFKVLVVISNTQMIIHGNSVIGDITSAKIYPVSDEGYMSYYQNNIISELADFQEFYTFNYDQTVANNYIGNYLYDYVENNFILANNVFGGSFNYVNNRFGDFCYNNSFEDDCTENTVENYFRGNITNNDFDDNIIGNYFQNNIITSDFQDNTIGNYFSENYIFGYDGDHNFSDNVISNYFENNSIYAYFERNHIGLNYYNNRIFYNCYDNAIKNSMYNNEIGNILTYNSYTFEKNNIDYRFEENEIYQNFSKNTVGNEFKGNLITGWFEDNFIRNQFANNEVEDDFYYNNIQNFVLDNNFQGTFYDNKVGNWCVGNNFNDTSNNDIKGGFEGNQLGNNFNNNVITNYFSNNSTGSDFTNNQINAYLNNVDFTFNYGKILTVSYTMSGDGIDGVYNSVVGTTDLLGVNATFNIEIVSGELFSVSVQEPGKLYVVNEVITVPGSSVGGVNVVLTVTSLYTQPVVNTETSATIVQNSNLENKLFYLGSAGIEYVNIIESYD